MFQLHNFLVKVLQYVIYSVYHFNDYEIYGDNEKFKRLTFILSKCWLFHSNSFVETIISRTEIELQVKHLFEMENRSCRASLFSSKFKTQYTN